MRKQRILVDMSATLLHHGHIRLLRQAAQLGHVVVALTTDDEIRTRKGYTAELNYEERCELLQGIRYVDEVVPCTWLIDDAFLDRHNIDLLVHGDDNVNPVCPERQHILPRTEGISSSDLRERVLNSLISLNMSGNSTDVSEKIARVLIETIKKEFRLD